MASLRDVAITFEIEPIVKIVCHAFECKHNLSRFAGAYCNLKHFDIGEKHVCTSYESASKSVIDD